MAPLGAPTNNKLTTIGNHGAQPSAFTVKTSFFDEVFLCNKSADNGKVGSIYFTTITNWNEFLNQQQCV